MWYLKFKIPATDEIRESSTGTRLKKDALREAETLNAQLLNQKCGIVDGSIPMTTLFDRFINTIGVHGTR